MENKKEFNIPQEANYDQADAFEYYANEEEFSGDAIPNSEIDEEERYRIQKFAAKKQKVGASALKFALSFGSAA